MTIKGDVGLLLGALAASDISLFFDECGLKRFLRASNLLLSTDFGIFQNEPFLGCEVKVDHHSSLMPKMLDFIAIKSSNKVGR